MPDLAFTAQRREFLRLRGLSDNAIARLEHAARDAKASIEAQKTKPTPGQTRDDLANVAAHCDAIAAILGNNEYAETELVHRMTQVVGQTFGASIPSAMKQMAAAARGRASRLPAQGRGGPDYSTFFAAIEQVTSAAGIPTVASGPFALIVAECCELAEIELPRSGIASRIRQYLKNRPPNSGG